jgi:hypothetical protein
MKKITILMALFFSTIGIGQNLSQETVQPYNGQTAVRTSTATTQTEAATSLGLSTSTRAYNGTSYNNPATESMMPVLAYTSGPYFNVPGAPDLSVLENVTLAMGTFGSGVQISAGNRISDDIVLADDYDVTSMEFFAYQSFTPTAPPTIDAINMQVWDGDPSLAGSTVVYGDATTNVLTSVVWSGAYRQLEDSPGNTDRPIHRITVETPGLSLAAGTYWVDWQIGGTAASGPWQPPVAILGQTTTGNAQQSIGGVWAALQDGGSFTPQGAPIEVYGDCTSCGGGGGGTDFFVKDGFPTDNFGTMAIAGPYTIATIASIPTLLFADDFAADGNLYAAEFFTGDIYTINTTTGAQTLVTPVTGIGTNLVTGMAFDFQTDTMYLLGADNFTLANQLYSVDLTTGVATPVGVGAAYDGGIWIEITNDGVGYVASITTDDLWTVDLATGAATLVGPIGINLNNAQDATYDVESEILYAGIYDGGTTSISTIDLTTGAATVLGTANFEAVMLSIEGVFLTNDVCSEAIAMECGGVETGDTAGNTDAGGFNDSPDAWYSYTGSGALEFVTFSLCDGGTTYDSRLTVFDACGGAVVAGNDDFCGAQSEVSFVSDGSSTYYVAVEGFGTTDVGAFSIAVTCGPVEANDLCEDAVALACDSVTAGSTIAATIDTGVAQDCTDDGGGPVTISSPGVWYTYTEATFTGLVSDITLSTCDDADFDTKISVYEGDCGALTCLAANDDGSGCGGFTSELTFQSDGVSTYYILVHGFGGQTGDFNLTLSCAPIAPFNDMIVNSIDADEIGFPYTDPSVPMPAATTEAGGTPAVCDNAGVLGVWYNFVAEMGGTATASVTSPAGYTSVTFYTAPDEEAVETDLTLVDWFDNQCVPGADASIPVTAGQAYYVYVANHEGITDIVIDGDFYLGVGDAVIDGFTYFPNPANNELNLDAGTRSIDNAVIYNILGQAVVDQNVGATSTRLDVANLSIGTYIMKVVVEGEVGIYKIVKQ